MTLRLEEKRKYRWSIKSGLVVISSIIFMMFNVAIAEAYYLNPLIQIDTKNLGRLVANVPRNHGHSSKKIVPFNGAEKPGTIVISNSQRKLHYVLSDGMAEQYQISVGRDGFTWTGRTTVGRKAEWPDWRPPDEMRRRDPSLPDMVPAGPFNPLGARAIYLFNSDHDTLYRIHGTNNSASIGGYETSGCFRLSNRDVLDLYDKVRVGSKVIVKQ